MVIFFAVVLCVTGVNIDFLRDEQDCNSSSQKKSNVLVAKSHKSQKERTRLFISLMLWT